MYSVEHIAEDTVTLKMLPEYRSKAETDAEVETVEAETADAETEETEETADVSTAKEEVTMPLDDVAHVLRLPHAMCYYTAKGALFEATWYSLIRTTSTSRDARS